MAESENQYFPQSRPHPGETLKEKLDEMGMDPKEFAHLTGTPENVIIAILNEESPITTDMAVQFENVTKIPATFWVNHQKGYDEYIASKPPKRKIGILEGKAKVDFKEDFSINEEDLL
jgi:HTH-type transcriptional regulator / antitoxin HigA